jgi:GGDEF domain-containing protein
MSINLLDPENILSMLESLEKQDSKYAGITFSTRQYFFVDPMMPIENNLPGIGNKLAFEFFTKKMKPGYYISMDANDFKIANKTSHIMGDLAIKIIGRTLRNATLKITDSKLFRSGGDEFLFYCEKKESIFLFIENALKEIDALELVGNVYKITLSFGIGISYSDAEAALLEAKNQKTLIRKNLIHSNITPLVI